MSEVLFLWFLPMIFFIIFLVYLQKNLEDPVDNFWVILLFPFLVVPVLNLILLIVVVAISPIIMSEYNINPRLKDTKLNRFLFRSKFKNK